MSVTEFNVLDINVT